MIDSMASDASTEVLVIDVEARDIPDPRILSIRGNEYEFFCAKDLYWMKFFIALDSHSVNTIAAVDDLLKASLSSTDYMLLQRDIFDQESGTDFTTLMSVVVTLVSLWEDYVLGSMQSMNVKIPESVRESLEKKTGRKVGPRKALSPSRK